MKEADGPHYEKRQAAAPFTSLSECLQPPQSAAPCSPQKNTHTHTHLSPSACHPHPLTHTLSLTQHSSSPFQEITALPQGVQQRHLRRKRSSSSSSSHVVWQQLTTTVVGKSCTMSACMTRGVRYECDKVLLLQYTHLPMRPHHSQHHAR